MLACTLQSLSQQGEKMHFVSVPWSYYVCLKESTKLLNFEWLSDIGALRLRSAEYQNLGEGGGGW